MNETSIQLFEHEQFGNLRVIEDANGNPMFCAKDVAVALGYKDTINAIKRHCRGVAFQHPIVDSLGREQTARFITEGDMYRLIASSKLESAVRFESWVFDDVLPSIRKHGMYATPQTVEQMLADPDTMIATLKALKSERQKVVALTEDNARMLPKSVAYDAMIDTDGTTTITQVSRYLNQMGTPMTARKLYGLLRADELVCKRDNAPTKKAISKGLAKQVMTVRSDGKQNAPYARLTQRGVDWCVTHYANMPAQMKAM